jgi:hypothetical protein
MSRTLKIIYAALTGALGALAAWFILDVLFVLHPENVYLNAVLNGAVGGLCIGAVVNGFPGLMVFKLGSIVKGTLIGGVAGLLGGALGLVAGEAAFQYWGGGWIPRVFGWVIFGASIGVVNGILILSARRMLYAGLGGLLGGALGGAVFSLMSQSVDLPNTSRSLGFAFLGFFVGLCVSWVPVVLGKAWIKVLSSGRSEGDERMIDKAHLVIGADRNCDLTLYGDETVQPHHAEINQENGQFTINALDDHSVLVNSQSMSRYILQNKDVIQLGSQQLIFFVKK